MYYSMIDFMYDIAVILDINHVLQHGQFASQTMDDIYRTFMTIILFIFFRYQKRPHNAWREVHVQPLLLSEQHNTTVPTQEMPCQESSQLVTHVSFPYLLSVSAMSLTKKKKNLSHVQQNDFLLLSFLQFLTIINLEQFCSKINLIGYFLFLKKKQHFFHNISFFPVSMFLTSTM